MLSRVAERIYWLGRYLERVENTARLVNVYGNVLLDLPRPAELVWESLLAITGSGALFSERYARADERAVVKFYLADRANPDSVLSASAAARENARTVREIVPAGTWEAINDLHIFLQDRIEGALARRGRDACLTHVIAACQHIAGTIAGTMSRDAAYQFLRAGCYLERADMTSRIVDVGTANVFPWLTSLRPERGDAAGSSPYEGILWMSVLRSLNALQMYRRLVPERVRADEVVAFLLQDEAFPRAIVHCLEAVLASFEPLPRNDAAVAIARKALARLRAADAQALLAHGLFDFIDAMQIEFNALHGAISETWFLPGDALA